MLTPRTVRRAAWRLGWVGVAVAVALQTTGCASVATGPAVAQSTAVSISPSPSPSPTPTPIPTTTTAATTATTTTTAPTPDWNPHHLATVEATIGQGTATIHVGERLHFAPSDEVNFSVQPTDLKNLTWYGSDLTFVGVAAGVTTLTIPNYDKHFDCPNGPCAHLNEPLSLRVTVLPAASAAVRAPSFPAAITITSVASARTVHIEVGQQIHLPQHVSVSGYTPAAAGMAETGTIGQLEDSGGAVTLVGAGPGAQVFGLRAETSSSDEVRLTVIVDS